MPAPCPGVLPMTLGAVLVAAAVVIAGRNTESLTRWKDPQRARLAWLLLLVGGWALFVGLIIPC